MLGDEDRKMGDVEAAVAGHFMALAVQYLVAGRAAAALKLSIIPGNLLHHAIEMELKSLLVTEIGLEKLGQKKYGHNLASLWLAAVVRHPDLGSSARQATVEQLDRFESLRYPDDMIEQGAAIRLEWTASDPLPALTCRPMISSWKTSTNSSRRYTSRPAGTHWSPSRV
jgi:hypothetical protein